MIKLKICTNNPLVEAKYPEIACVYDSGPEGVLIAARDMIHNGAKLISHPLSGGVLPGFCPYKSLVVSNNGETDGNNIDFASLGLIEESIRVLVEAPKGFPGYDENTLEDFRVLDLDMIQSALASLGYCPSD